MKYLQLLTVLLFVLGCKNESTTTEKPLTANEIVDKSIEVSGGKRFNASKISFGFRDKEYYAKRDNGHFELQRLTIAGNGDSIFDILSNNGFQRKIQSNFITVEDSMATRYTASVNSVHYFSVLPYGLNDKAVNKTLIGEERIKNNNYYKIEVTFDEVGGGEDFEDVFIYWIHTESFEVDYLAYSYNEADGKGMRFREAYNERYVKGLRFVDYNNYKPKDLSVALENLAKVFTSQQLVLVSKIDLKDVAVKLMDKN